MLTQCGRETGVNSQLEELMSERLTLPVLPLREIVLFPGVSTPIGAGRPTTLRAIEAALKGDSRLIFAVSQRENVDHVTPGVLYTTGTIAKISQIQRGLGGVQLLLHGEKRGVALHYVENQGHLEAVVREVVGERQRELVLREQMKAIRKELGEGDEASDVEELRKRLAALELPEAAQKEVDRELARLERAARDSMEAQVIRTYLETVAE